VLHPKWRLDVSNWKPGDMPRRRRTAQELAESLDLSVGKEALDEKVVSLREQAMAAREYYRLSRDEMGVALDSSRDGGRMRKSGSGGWHPDSLDSSQRRRA
jgi:hypothetical protein